jgi:hypothetical protein
MRKRQTHILVHGNCVVYIANNEWVRSKSFILTKNSERVPKVVVCF